MAIFRFRNPLSVANVLAGVYLLFGLGVASALADPALIGGPQDQAVAVHPAGSEDLLVVGVLFEGAAPQGAWVAGVDRDLMERWRRDYVIDGTLGIGASLARELGGAVIAIPRVRSTTGEAAHGPPEDQRMETVLIAVDGAGNLAWDTILHVASGVQVTAIQPDGADGYLVGGLAYNTPTEQVAWIARLDGIGNIVWHRSIPGGSQVRALARQQDGRIVVAGSAVVSDDPLAIVYEAPWMSVLEADGRVVWSSTVGNGQLGMLSGLHLIEDTYVTTGHVYDRQVEATQLSDENATGWIAQFRADGSPVRDRRIEALDTVRGSLRLESGRLVIYGVKDGHPAAVIASLEGSGSDLALLDDQQTWGAANAAMELASGIILVGQVDTPIDWHGAWILRAAIPDAR